jgi:uncharacterized protein YggE
MISLILAIVLAGCGATSTSSGATSEIAHTIFVTGVGEAIGEPDVAVINLGVNITGSEVVTAVDEANAIIDAIGQAVEALGVESQDVTTVAFNVWPEYRWDPETGQQTDVITYHIDSNIRVVVRQVETMGEVISAGLEAGANNVYGIEFNIQDTTALEAEARIAAVADARARADSLAAEMGVSVGEPVSISENSYATPYVSPIIERAAGMGGGDAAPISPGQMTVQIQVTVTFELIND